MAAAKLLASTLLLPAIYANCPGLSIPENGITECSKDDNTKQLTCTVRCDPGYFFENSDGLQNVAIFACQSNSKWAPVPNYGDCILDENSKLGQQLLNEKSETEALLRARIPTETTHASNTCLVWNNQHIKTFDGAQYSFKGIDCTYLLTSDCVDDSFELYLKHINEYETQLILSWAGQDILLETTSAGNHIATNLSEKKNIQIPGRDLAGLSLESINDHFVIKGPNEFQISWDTRTNKIMVKGDNNLKNRTCGLCGNFNNNPADDFQTLDGKAVSTSTALALSWILPGGICYDVPKPVDDMCEDHTTCDNLLYNPNFQVCHEFVDPSVFQQTCHLDNCSNQCSTLEAYIKICKNYGVKIDNNWRLSARCPTPKCSGNREWVECGATCENSCDQINFMNILESECEESNCFEGCRCPAGTYTCPLTNSCVPKEFCPCNARSQLYS